MNHFIQPERWTPPTGDLIPFSQVVDLAHRRHSDMSPEDRNTHLNKHAYANIQGCNAIESEPTRETLLLGTEQYPVHTPPLR